LPDFVGNACGMESKGKARRWRETLPDGVSYETLDCLDNSLLDDTDVFDVAPGRYFMLGDNRDNSSDSRMADVGTIPLENLIGRVEVIFFSRNAGGGRCGRSGSGQRCGEGIFNAPCPASPGHCRSRG
jgi:signal peptidase I